MLTLSHDATQAIEQILEHPDLPEGAGVRISATPESSGNGAAADPVALQMAVAGEPAGDDQVIEDAGARVFVQDVLSEALADKELDAAVEGERVEFRLADQP